VDLKIVYGDPGKDDSLKGNSVDLESGIFRANRFFRLGHTELTWQPVLSELRGADLVIAEQASKLLVNYPLLIRQLLGRQKFAFWGHGRNFQTDEPDGIRERLKRWMLPLPHWWFTYTEGTAKYIEEVGFPRERITVVYNTIDSQSLINERATISSNEIAQVRERLGIASDNVCIYIGSMYPEKRIEFLLEACRHIRRRIPDFTMLFLGAGSSDGLVMQFCSENAWAKFPGAAFGRDKVKYSAAARLMLMPGLVGLAIIDSFALQVPIITTAIPWHSPEIEYLENDRNGIIVGPMDDVERYAATVADLLTDYDRRSRLVENCRKSASAYTTQRMVSCFLEGIEQSLSKT
jgi:glycosyltransferase involved in cell wall biosynthesis